MPDYPYAADLKIEEIAVNLYNPNVMTDDEFELLERNIQEIGFLDPILVVPQVGPEGQTYYRIIDGEHRFEAQQISGAETVSALVVDPAIFDEKTQKIQTVRMNQIHGSLDIGRFNNLVNDLVNNHNVPFEEIATELGFADEDEFMQLIEETRRSLPQTPGMKKEFDAKIKEVKSHDDLIKLVERLYRKYGDTLPANYLILDFGRQHNLMVRFNASDMGLLLTKFREIFDHGYTVDSIILNFFKGLDVSDYVKNYAGNLMPIEKEADIDELMTELQIGTE